jgi:catalase
MSEARLQAHHENPFDVTKTWSQKEFPLIEVGELELNRNPLNYFAEVEQAHSARATWCRVLAVAGPHAARPRIRLRRCPPLPRGHQPPALPVNAPRSPVHSYQRDGSMASGSNGSAPNYEPNSYAMHRSSRRVMPSRAGPERCG